MCGYSPHFTGEETEVRRGEATCSESRGALWDGDDAAAYNNVNNKQPIFIELYVQSSLHYHHGDTRAASRGT